ncbi:Long-chain-fatty-acid--CoA ligase FadD13 [Maioricimonas rarisocia]|uniref:Long-chain-fatty-acid--CoA ligase FadD13 n=1 Tax=Maioricimonas rarisocia TaxID=2528026 RepID=A0A517Z9C0_9PLAN|nr:fatty acid CoA ligase family protein [Maioricimonas rarisocia]QDU39078.1 Long-chain-fatty-acid--CoA ligase FadD13 [Maioricimonas rarisocia]
MSSSTADSGSTTQAGSADRLCNIAQRLRESAVKAPDTRAVIQPLGRDRDGNYRYAEWTFAELDRESDRLAAGLREFGVEPGDRMVLFVPFSREFIALTFALYKVGATIVLIDPGMGRTNIFRCLEEVDPHGFVAVPIVHAVRLAKRKLFPNARKNVTVGRRWFWGGTTYEKLRSRETDTVEIAPTRACDPAAVIFTSGSTGAPKGVLYEHGMFDAQVDLIRDFYGIEPGEVDLPGFPLFGLFNAAMGVTTVIPDMDPTKPARVDPERMIAHIRDHQVTQAFGSPAFWNRVGRYCTANEVTLPTIRRGLSAGGPVPNHVLERMSRTFVGEGAALHTPYGATESLPVASISSAEVLQETAEQTRQGAGTCVGHCFPGVEVKLIEINDGPIAAMSDARDCAPGEIGEIVVRSPSVTREYYRRPDATALAKIPDPNDDGRPVFWHRIGDVGYLDDEGRLWFCGRKAHIVVCGGERMFSVRCEAIFNCHPRVYRSALVGLGEAPDQRPVIVVEPEEDQFPESPADKEQLRGELLELAAASPLTQRIRDVLFHRSLPVDTRHNVKINRELLAEWAAGQEVGSRK